MAVAPNLINLPDEAQWSDSQGITMRYRKIGKGPPLLLVHGLLGGSFCWRFTIPYFARDYTVYAVDLPGSGLSDVPPDTDCSMLRQSERLAEFLDDMKLENVAVMGCSFGGGVALLLAARDSQQPKKRIRTMVLVAPVNPWSANGSGRIRFFSSALGSFLLRLGMPVSHPAQRWGLHRMYADTKRIAPGSERGYARMIIRPDRASNVLTTLRHWSRDLESIRAAIPHIQVPTLLVWGAQDGAVDPQSCLILQQRLPQCQAAAIEGVGHLPMEETPEAFNELAAKYLAAQV